MPATSRMYTAATLTAVGVGLAAGTYAALVGLAWTGYGHVPEPDVAERDDLLDRFMPSYDIVERHHIGVNAPADVVLAAAKDQDLLQSPIVRAIFKAREIVLGAVPDSRPQPRGLVAVTEALGWGVLADTRDREIVMGAVTKPWEGNVVFRAIPPQEFAAFRDPDYVKIVWTLRADPIDERASIFRTETRAVATDAAARAKFRRYWSLASPGISAIRWLSLRPLKRAAEGRSLG